METKVQQLERLLDESSKICSKIIQQRDFSQRLLRIREEEIKLLKHEREILNLRIVKLL